MQTLSSYRFSQHEYKPLLQRRQLSHPSTEYSEEIRALTSPKPSYPLTLTAPAPYTLQQAVPLRQPIETIVTLAHGPDESTQSIHLVLARVSPILVHLADGYLYRGVIFGFDDAVGS